MACPSDKTKRDAFVNKDVEIALKVVPKNGQLNIDNKRINSFLEIRWQDPFPDENTTIGKDQDEFILNSETLVYPDELLDSEYPPIVITRPSDLIMLKLMRACIAC